MENYDNRLKELGKFLAAKRKSLNVEDYGIEITSRRRTKGLRREEVSVLCGLSLTLYTWLEQGRYPNVSADILKSLSRVFKLSENEREYIFELAQSTYPIKKNNSSGSLEESYQVILDNFRDLPAYIIDSYWNTVAWNEKAVEIFCDYSKLSQKDRNSLWRIFNNESVRDVYINLEQIRRDMVASFRARNVGLLDDEWYLKFVEDLKNGSPEFIDIWENHNVNYVNTGIKKIKHHQFKELNLKHLTLKILDGDNYFLILYVPNDEYTEKCLIKMQ